MKYTLNDIEQAFEDGKSIPKILYHPVSARHNADEFGDELYTEMTEANDAAEAMWDWLTPAEKKKCDVEVRVYDTKKYPPTDYDDFLTITMGNFDYSWQNGSRVRHQNDFRRLLDRYGMTAASFARLSGIPCGTVRAWCCYARTPAPYVIKLIEFWLSHRDV